MERRHGEEEMGQKKRGLGEEEMKIRGGGKKEKIKGRKWRVEGGKERRGQRAGKIMSDVCVLFFVFFPDHISTILHSSTSKEKLLDEKDLAWLLRKHTLPYIS